MEWLFNKYTHEHSDDIKGLLIKSFGETLKLDAETPKLKEFSLVFMLIDFTIKSIVQILYYKIFIYLGNNI